MNDEGADKGAHEKGNNMYIGNNFMVIGTFYNRAAVNEYFIDEQSAREYANRLYGLENTKSIELLQRQRVGYVKVKKLFGIMKVRSCGWKDDCLKSA